MPFDITGFNLLVTDAPNLIISNSMSSMLFTYVYRKGWSAFTSIERY